MCLKSNQIRLFPPGERQAHWLTGLLAGMMVSLFCPSLSAETNPSGIEFFEKRIRPVLAENCYTCHGPEEQEGHLRLDRYHDMLQGGLSGPAVVPGKVDASLLATAVRYVDSELQMPPDTKLSASQIADLLRWVQWGAPHPDASQPEGRNQRGNSQDDPSGLSNSTEAVGNRNRKAHWAFQPLREPGLPSVRNSQWVRSPIDLFVLHRLEGARLSPGPAADRRTLIRRATFDLTGLPPTLKEVENYLADRAPGAFARVVDRLLASPQYGVRWGRHWLDVVRYADSNGLDENVAQANAWRYRDYVVDSLNQDKPYDLFVREQLAGDLMPTDDPQIRNQRLIATGFLSLGPKVLAEVDETKMEMDIIDEQIDTMGKSLLGMTLGCSRCHDHKFDPITTTDYYALAGIFKSTHSMDSFTKVARWFENSLYDQVYQTEKSNHDRQVAKLQLAVDGLLTQATNALKQQLSAGASLPARYEESFPKETRDALVQLRADLVALKKKGPVAPSAMGVKEGTPVDVAIHLRGSHLTQGAVVPRGVPAILTSVPSRAIPMRASGRFALAQALTDARNPLLARVVVNRVWRWHFGHGIVSTPDNLGVMGERPTHPELLDWLAIRLMRDGWSLKRLHRQLMMSSAYRLGSDFHAVSARTDPQNRLLWRANPRRLEAEELRDALLSVVGQLDLSLGGPVLETKNREFVFNHTSQDNTQYESRRRSLYLPVIRNHLADCFTLFDYTDASLPNGDRNTSTVASQALYLLNSKFLAEVSGRLAQQILSQKESQEADRINQLYQQTLRRPATAQEIVLARQTLSRLRHLATGAKGKQSQQHELEAWRLVCQALLISHEFVYVR